MQEDAEETSVNENDLTSTDLQEEIYTEDECAEMISEIDKLKDAKIIENQLHETLHKTYHFLGSSLKPFLHMYKMTVPKIIAPIIRSHLHWLKFSTMAKKCISTNQQLD